MTKHTPATPLPWETLPAARSNLVHVETSTDHAPVCSLPKARADDAAYIAHAANAYPKLVEALRDAANGLDTTGQTTPQSNAARNNARALLRELGEE